MIFSSISIIITVISMVTEKKILNSQGYAMVEFEVTGPSISSNTHQFRNNIKQIRNEISNILGVNERLIEIIKPMKIPHGLRFTINIHLNRISVRDNDYPKLFAEAQIDGSLAEIFQNSWNLQDPPKVSHIEFRVNESKKWKQSVVSISMNGEAIGYHEKIAWEIKSNNLKSNNDDDKSMEEENRHIAAALPAMPEIKETDGMIDDREDSDDSDEENACTALTSW